MERNYPTIVIIGCGLDTTFDRPMFKTIRNQLAFSNKIMAYLSDMFKMHWMAHIKFMGETTAAGMYEKRATQT
ncbi:MAG: hypothetical protein R6U50_04275 [Desulfobacterales bacterium]